MILNDGCLFFSSLQSSFEKQGFRPKSLTFDSGEADLDAELLRVLMEAKQVSRGMYRDCYTSGLYVRKINTPLGTRRQRSGKGAIRERVPLQKPR